MALIGLVEIHSNKKITTSIWITFVRHNFSLVLLKVNRKAIFDLHQAIVSDPLHSLITPLDSKATTLSQYYISKVGDIQLAVGQISSE